MVEGAILGCHNWSITLTFYIRLRYIKYAYNTYERFKDNVRVYISQCSTVLHCCKGDQLFLWIRAKLGVPEIRNPWTDCQTIWHWWLCRRYDPASQNSNRSPQWERPSKWVKYHSGVVFNFLFFLFVITIFARVPRLNRGTDFYAVSFIGCQSRVIDFLLVEGTERLQPRTYFFNHK